MSIEVTTPEQFLGDVIGDLNRRRGLIEGQRRPSEELPCAALAEVGNGLNSRLGHHGRAVRQQRRHAGLSAVSLEPLPRHQLRVFRPSTATFDAFENLH